MLEKTLERKLQKAVEKLGGVSFKWISTVTGVPDRIVILKTKVYFVEMKTPSGKVSPRQALIFQTLEKHGFPVVILRNEEEIEQFVNSR